MAALPRAGVRGLLLALLAFLFVGVIATFYLQAQRTSLRIREIIAADLVHDVHLIKLEQRSIIERAREAVLHAMAAVPPDAPRPACRRWLAGQLERNVWLNNMGVALTNGDVRCQAAAGSIDSIADRDYFVAALRSEEFALSGPIRSRATGKPVLAFAKAMRDERGVPTAVYFAGLDLGWLPTALSASHYGQGMQLTVLDEAGNVLVSHPDASDGNLSGTGFLRAVAQRGEGTMEVTGPGGESQILAFTPLLETQRGRLYMTIGIPADVVYAPARKEFWASFWQASILFLLVIAVMYRAGEHFFVRRIEALHSAVKRFGGGDTSARSGVQYAHDEIGGLARSFDRMAQRLEDRERELSHVTRALRVLSSGNRAMLQAADEKQLVEAMCNIAVATGGYRIAAIGYVDGEQNDDIRVVAACGPDPRFGEQLQAYWNERHAEGVARAAIREGHAVVTRHMASQRHLPQRQALAERFGFGSILALPLLREGPPLGALVVCAREPDAFSDEETAMLGEFAHDLAFGIAAHRERGLRARLEESLGRAEEQLRGIADASLDVLMVLKAMRGTSQRIEAFEIVHVNRRAEQILGLNREVLVGRRLSGELACYTEMMFDEYVAVCEGGKAKDVEFHVTSLTGASMWLRQQIVPMRGGVAVFSRDITTDRDNLAQLSRANRKLRMLSRIHETLARSAVEPDMLQSICEIVAEDKTHQSVSIAYLQAGASVFRLIAIASTDDGYHEEMRRAIADVHDGEQTASRAVRTGVPQVARHPAPAAPGSARQDLTSVPRRCASELALPVRVHGKAIGVLSVHSREPEAFDAEEVSLFADIADAAGFGIAHCRTAAERDEISYQHRHHAEILRQALEQTIRAVSATVEMRDPYTAGHQRRVAELATAIAAAMGVAEDRIEGLRLAAMVHDLGKITIPAEILAKPASLSDIEYMLVKGHARAGYDILKGVRFPWPIADIILQHHERLDGSGYPGGLKGSEILLEARILAVADTVEAIASHRPYRPSAGIEAALRQIEADRGRALDADAVHACLKLFRERRFSFSEDA